MMRARKPSETETELLKLYLDDILDALESRGETTPRTENRELLDANQKLAKMSYASSEYEPALRMYGRIIEALETALAEVSRYRAALREEYREGFNDLGTTRQSRWESAEAYADALMADFDSASTQRDNSSDKSENSPRDEMGMAYDE